MTKTIKGNLVLEKDTVFNESIDVKASMCEWGLLMNVDEKAKERRRKAGKPHAQ